MKRIGALIVAACLGCSPTPSTTQPATVNGVPVETSGEPYRTLRVDAERTVKRYLAYPRDSYFKAGAMLFKPEDGSHWIVGEFTTPNGFGATLTKEYKVKYVDHGGKWEVGGVMIDGEVAFVSP